MINDFQAQQQEALAMLAEVTYWAGWAWLGLFLESSRSECVFKRFLGRAGPLLFHFLFEM